MISDLRRLLLLASFALLPLSAHAQSGQGATFSGVAGALGSTVISAPTSQGPCFDNQGGSQSSEFCNGGGSQSLGNQIGPQAPAGGPADTRTIGPRAAGSRLGSSGEDQASQRRQEQSGQPETAALPPLGRDEFQDLITQSTGRVLPRYGFNLFTNAPSTFAPVDNIPMTLDYVIGPGDELLLRIWGRITGEFRLAVDRDGNINIPQIGTISVAGISIKDLQGYLRTAIERNFRDFELSVSLGKLRSIQIFVVGQARRPGSYTVSALSTLVNALFASGGPSGVGSMRRIELKRGDKTISVFDVYDFLNKGDKSKDVRLLPGDVIYIPPEGRVVAISGSVKVPAIYELKGKESIADIIDLAGGLTTTAAEQKVLLERIENHKARRVDDFPLDQAGLAHSVKDGDLISVLSISPKFDNAVTLRGNVATPLRYPYHEGMRITDLIPDKEALIVPGYYANINLATRVQVKSPNQLVNEIVTSGTDINWDYALIERQNAVDLTPTLLNFDLGKAVLEHDPANNLLLKPGDVVTVFSTNDFSVPQGRRTKIVILEDEFNHPGVYRAEPGETLRELVVRAGGVSPGAYLFGAEFTRESTRIAQQKSLDEAISRLQVDAQQSLAASAQNVSSGDTDSIKQQAAAQQAVLARLRQIKATGRIILKRTSGAQAPDIPDLLLENGDRLKIPSRPATVSVFGAVYNQGSFMYEADQSVGDYLAEAGGPTRTADAGAIYVLKADGSVVSKRQSWVGSFSFTRVMPGDTIVVPEDFDRTTWMKELKDWTQILYQMGLGAAAIHVLGK